MGIGMTKVLDSTDKFGRAADEPDSASVKPRVRGEPIAVVGMACRFPGAPSIPALWNLLEAGQNAVQEVAPGAGVARVDELFSNPSNPGEACRFCAYVDEIEQFDAGFFRISPVEAHMLDPQQRMMLETTWQALEDAGIDPGRLRESRTGVYTGISNDEYRMLVVESSKPVEAAECLYALSGTNLNGTAGRVSYVLGLMGPAKAVDAACASSLVSVHDAVADLQHGRADLAIAGGVQAILNGRIFELRADSMMLSPDGQCKAFDASANGYVRGEGCGVVILKRLREAEADGDRIWGVIRGSAVNHGGASVGLTVPHAPGLEQVIEDALAQAEVAPSAVDYLEAHGTGTAVGDPIELNAVSAVYGRERPADRPLLVGSIKTNVGHLESAAGIAGLIKAVLVLQRGVIPKHLHFEVPNPSLDWDRMPVQVTAAKMDLPKRNGRARLAGVNSFGISGTNVHLVVEEYAVPDRPHLDLDEGPAASREIAVALPRVPGIESLPREGLRRREARMLPLSGKSDAALAELAQRYLKWLDDHDQAVAGGSASAEALLSDIAWTAGVGRSHFEQRAAIVFDDARLLRQRLSALTEVGRRRTQRAATKVAFAYTGQGSQWTGMGEGLYQREPVARAVLDRCEDVFRSARGTSLLDVMFGRSEGDLSDTAWEQPALYALECALTALWASVGVHPSVVLGHSVGELAAAQAAGVFSLEDGMRFAVARGTLLARASQGAMAAVFAAPETVAKAVKALNAARAGAAMNISADNGNHQVVSGPVEAIGEICKSFERDGIRVRRLNTARAFHSALVEPVLESLEASLDGVAIKTPATTVVSNLTGRALEPGQALDGAYWKRHARHAVAFARGVRTLAELEIDLVVEIGPRPVLAGMVASAWPDSAGRPSPTAISSLRPQQGDVAGTPDGIAFTQAVADAYEAGLPIRFEGLFAGETRRRISLPGYPFQRERYWLDAKRRRRAVSGHPLLGVRHESASGEITFETEVSTTDPAWMNDHQVFGRVIAPGALYGAMAATAALAESEGPVLLEDMQLRNPLVFGEGDPKGGESDDGRKMQLVLDSSGQADPRRVQVFSRGSEEDWTIHVEGRASPHAPTGDPAAGIAVEGLTESLTAVDVTSYYRARAATGIDLGPSFRTLRGLWSQPGEALGQISLPESLGRNRLEVHPLLLDGCFQVVAAARNPGGIEEGTTYLPFGWETLWLKGPLPNQLFCHVQMNPAPAGADADETPEALSCEVRIYDSDGAPVGELTGYTVKRATRATLLSASEGVTDLIYEIVWRDGALTGGTVPADFLPSPSAVAASAGLLSAYLSEEGVAPKERAALLTDLERWSRSRALATLDQLGWQRAVGETVDPDALRQRLGVIAEHGRVFRRMIEMLAKSGVLEQTGTSLVVRIGSEDPWPVDMPRDLDGFADQMAMLHPHGSTEIGLFQRCGDALPDVLRGRADPLTLLFSSGSPTPGDLYLKAPVARAANRILRETVQTLVSGLPDGRRLRVIEVGAGTGSATAAILPELPEGRFDYVYTDISAGFFAEAEGRFGGSEASIDYRPLDIEKDPVDQGFDHHGYDLLIASNVLHATRYLQETLAHCLDLLAPSGQLVALENLSGVGWMDLTFGQLDGWWRFADDYRPHHALASPAVWRRALADVGFDQAEVLGVDESDPAGIPDKGVIVAQGPAEVTERPFVWVLATGRDGAAEELAAELTERNQTVLLAHDESTENGNTTAGNSGLTRKILDIERRESWQSLFSGLPEDVTLGGIVHCVGLDGHGETATTDEVGQDTRRATASALALTQGLLGADATPERGLWFLTRGAQVLERERGGELVGATLWGFGKAVAREAPHLKPRMIDLDPSSLAAKPDLMSELLSPDGENHIAYRSGRRQIARMVRAGGGEHRLLLPEESAWALAPDPDGSFEKPYVKPLPPHSLEPRQVRVAVEAAGLNFWDVFRSLGFIEEGNLGREMCGFVIEVGSQVTSVAVGDHIVGLGFGAFAAEMVTHEELVATATPGVSVTALATVPSAFVSAALSFELSGLEAGDRVLVHAGAGGVGLAAIQLAQASKAEVFATASARKRGYLRSLGVQHVFDSRRTEFARQILEATGGAGVDMVLNSLTGEGFIDASLSCLTQGGRFVEMARRDILSVEEMTAVRPDVAYSILELDVLKKTEPERVGRVLRGVMERLSAGELRPIIHSRWPLAEAGSALRFMRSARHLGKIVVTAPPIAGGRLRPRRTYLVTGGLGGIGCAVAGWLADSGAEAIVLNGRRPPDPEAQEVISALRARGITVRVEIADVTDTAALDAMLARTDRELPPLGGVIHSVGVLSDGALGNQNWQRFEQVLWPKVLGAWHLHRATVGRDLDLFILFSSRVGVMGNPGQANHAAANAFLDQLAAHRRALGLPGQAIAWGAWSEIGEAAEQKERIERQRAALGGRWFTPQQGLKAMDTLVRQDVTHSVVMSMDWDVFQEAVNDRPPLVEELLSPALEADSPSLAEDVLPRLQSTPAGGREGLLVSLLQEELQAVLRLRSAPSPKVGFFDLGMDSLMAVEFRNRLNRAFADAYVVSNTAVFDYPNIPALARHLAEELAGVGAQPAPRSDPKPQQDRRPRPPSATDHIAIVGMACRFPGAPNLAAFWHQLESGVDAVTDGRPDAGPWSGAAGDPSAETPNHRLGGFVEGLDRFDAKFFGIRPIEARMMDPRQRMLLETSWHALEDAGIDPDSIKGSRAGVYAGLGGSSEYRDLVAAAGQDDSYLGTAGSVAIGRIAFALGLMGPAVPVDMTCASSLVSVHQAVAALRAGEVQLALAGGVHAALSKSISQFLAEVGMLSASGRCRPFDAGADGFVRGEGCGIVVLKRLSDAEAAGDRIWGVIRGSAVNQNGASAALTVPNGTAQEQVIAEALNLAGIAPADIDYVEAHATGSKLGDPIEVRATAAACGKGREASRPLLLGTVKSNIGHLEPAAGIAGLIKVMLAMKRGVIPKHLHFDNPNPNIDWSELGVAVTSEAIDWPLAPGRPPRAGISAFALSGTNAHVVVEGYGTSERASALGQDRRAPESSARPVVVDVPASIGSTPASTGLRPRSGRLLPLSGKTGDALRAMAERYLSWLDERREEFCSQNGDAEAHLADMAWTAGVGRSHFGHRTGVVFDDFDSLRNTLRSLAESVGASAPQLVTNVAFAFAGEGSQCLGMGEELYETEPVARSVLDRCEAAMLDERGASLLDVMFGRPNSSTDLDDPAWAQPALFALECAIAAMWSAVGVRPRTVAGRGVGEVAAAQAAGVLDLAQGLRIAAARGRRAANYSENSFASTDYLAEALQDVVFSTPSLTLVSSVTGRPVTSSEVLNAGYWHQQVQEQVPYEESAQALADLGVDIVIEIGPQPDLGRALASTWPAAAGNGLGAPITVSSLGRPSADKSATLWKSGFASAIARAYEAGLSISFEALFAGERRSRISLPSYPFQRRPFWFNDLRRPPAAASD